MKHRIASSIARLNKFRVFNKASVIKLSELHLPSPLLRFNLYNEFEKCRHYHTSTPISSSKSSKVDEVFNKILELDTIEVCLLTELVNERLGYGPTSQAEKSAMTRGSSGGDGNKSEGGQDESAKKDTFVLKLTGFDAKSKIKVIKEIRGITGLGLKESKEMVEGAPSVIKKDIKKEEAEELKAKLEGIGGTVEVS